MERKAELLEILQEQVETCIRQAANRAEHIRLIRIQSHLTELTRLHATDEAHVA